jgi:hypothetical protein
MRDLDLDSGGRYVCLGDAEEPVFQLSSDILAIARAAFFPNRDAGFRRTSKKSLRPAGWKQFGFLIFSQVVFSV